MISRDLGRAGKVLADVLRHGIGADAFEGLKQFADGVAMLDGRLHAFFGEMKDTGVVVARARGKDGQHLADRIPGTRVGEHSGEILLHHQLRRVRRRRALRLGVQPEGPGLAQPETARAIRADAPGQRAGGVPPLLQMRRDDLRPGRA